MEPEPKDKRLHDRPLTPRMRRFIAEYLTDGNGTRAAIRAGYSPRTARVQASQMLSNVKVARIVQIALHQITKANQALVAPRVGELASLALLDPGDLYDKNGGLLPISKMPPYVRAVIAHVGARSPRQRQFLIERACLRAKRDALTMLAVYGGVRTTNHAADGSLSRSAALSPPLPAQIGGILFRQ
jgi:phage terminase small subunit